MEFLFGKMRDLMGFTFKGFGMDLLDFLENISRVELIKANNYEIQFLVMEFIQVCK